MFEAPGTWIVKVAALHKRLVSLALSKLLSQAIEAEQVFSGDSRYLSWPINLRHARNACSMAYGCLHDAQVGCDGASQKLPPEALFQNADIAGENFFQAR